MNTNKVMQANGDFLQTESIAKELISNVPAHSPRLSNYGGEEIPNSLVLVQVYETKKKETEGSGIHHQIFKPEIDKATGKPAFEMVEIGTDEKTGIKQFKKVMKFQNSYSFKETRHVISETIQPVLSVIPLRAKLSKADLGNVIGENLNELQRAITDGKPIKRTKIVRVGTDDKGNPINEEKETITTVKATIRKNAICHLFVKFDNMVFSTIQVNGGIKGTDLLTDFSASCGNFYQQIKSAMNADKPVQVSEGIAKALNLKPVNK